MSSLTFDLFTKASDPGPQALITLLLKGYRTISSIFPEIFLINRYL